MSAEAGPLVPAKIWDLPTRIVHWGLVALILVSWLTAGQQMTWHRWSGYGVLGLVVFRVYWGLFGASTARFSSFVKGPRHVAAYAGRLGDRAAAPSVGHNPLGALSVIALLLLLATQVAFGLFAVDIDGIESGPLSYLVDFDTGRLCARLHELTFRGLQGLIGLHIAAVGFYLIHRRQNLVAAMVTGRKRLAAGAEAVSFAPAWRLPVGVILAAAVVYLLATGLKF